MAPLGGTGEREAASALVSLCVGWLMFISHVVSHFQAPNKGGDLARAGTLNLRPASLLTAGLDRSPGRVPKSTGVWSPCCQPP
jgi:hypothetical protein